MVDHRRVILRDLPVVEIKYNKVNVVKGQQTEHQYSQWQMTMVGNKVIKKRDRSGTIEMAALQWVEQNRTKQN